MAKTVLVTGANGFIGTHLCKFLKGAGYKVKKYMRWRDGDICKIRSKHLKSVDYVVHLASTTHNYHILKRKETTIDVKTNCLGTIAVLNAIRATKRPIKLVYVSTFFVNNGSPLGLYGATNLCAEHICLAYSRVHDINVSIARPTNVYGEGSDMKSTKKNAISRMILDIKNGKPVKAYSECWYNVRDIIHVSDVVSALEIIMRKGENRMVYDVGSGESIPVSSMLYEAIKISKLKDHRLNIIEPPKFHKAVGMGSFHADIKRLKWLGWMPKVSIKQGIKNIGIVHL